MRLNNWLTTLAGVSVTLGVAAHFVPAQDAELDELPFQSGKEPNQGVYVRDSAVALEKLALGQRMERLKEWDKSADVFQEILEKYPDRVVQARTDAAGRIYQYSSVALAVQERLARWPEEGLRVYRRRFEPVAQSLLEQASPNDYATLHRVYSLYFVTEPGKQAAIRLMDLYLESGEFPAAAWLGDQLTRLHPSLENERPMVLYRTAIAYHLSGDETKAADRLATLRDKHSDAIGIIRGREVRLVDSLEADLKVPATAAHGNTADSWPMFMGSPDRARISSVRGTPGAQAVRSIAYSRGRIEGIDPGTLRAFEQQYTNDLAEGKATGVMPVLDRGELFFQDNARIYAISLESGLPLPGWAQTYSGDLNGRYTLPGAWPIPRGAQLTTTVTDDSVLAILGQTDRMALLHGMARQRNSTTRGPKLVCLDRDTGKERWAVSTADLPEEAAALRGLTLGGSPLVVGDNVYVTGRGGKGMQFEDCYVLCFDLRNGSYKWSCYIASAASGNMIMFGVNDEMLTAAETPALLSYSSGRLYVLSNLGAVAAVDAYRGSIVWLSIYPRDSKVDPNFNRRGFAASPHQQNYDKPWAYNPPVVVDGKLFAMPWDGQHLLIYDAGNGEEIKRIAKGDMDSATTLLGVVDDKVVVAGDSRAMCLNWEAYDREKFSRNSPAIIWPSARLEGGIQGRGFVAADAVFLPTRDKLVRIEMNSGKITELPRGGAWLEPARSDGRGLDGSGDQDMSVNAGNLLVTQEHIIVSGPQRVDVYTDLMLARKRLNREEEADPTNPEPRLRYAEVMFVAGEYDVAIQKLDEAIELLGGREAMKRGPSRDRVFTDALTFVTKLQQEHNRDAVANRRIEGLYDRAAAAASTPSHGVTYRISRARFAGTMKDPQTQVRLYQEILLDPAMRNVEIAVDDTPGGAGDSGTRRAGVVAENAIQTIIASVPAAYAPYESAAREAFDSSRVLNDAERLLAVAEMYPNAKVAPDAMLAAADSFEIAGQHRRATQILRRMYFRYPDTPHAARVIESLARNYLAMPNRIEVAASRLAAGARLGPNLKLQGKLKLPDGRELQDMTFQQALEEIRAYQATLPERPLPDMKLPVESVRNGAAVEPFLPLDPSLDIPGVRQLLIPPREHARHDRIVTWSTDGRVVVYPVGSPKALFELNLDQNTPRGVAWIGQELLVWTDQRLILLSDLGTRWNVNLQDLPTAHPVAGPARRDGWTGGPDVQNTFPDLQQMPRRGRMRAMPVDVISQTPVVAPNSPEKLMTVNATSDRIVVSTSTGRVFALDLANGQLAWQTRLVDERPLDRVLASDDFTVARIAEREGVRIAALDTFSGEVVNSWFFPNFPGPEAPNAVMNFALAPDGTLVFTLMDRIIGKDLHEPGIEPKWQNVIRNTGILPFTHAIQPDHLQISDGRVIAVSDMGRLVRLFDLQTGTALVGRDRGGNDVGTLNTSFDAARHEPNGLSRLTVRVSGPMIYIMGPGSLQACNLDRRIEKWDGALDVSSNLIDLAVSREFVVAFSDPLDRGLNNPPGPRAAVNLLAFARKRGSSESGLLTYDPILRDESGAGILSWQVVDGGIYYLGADQKLHFRQGAGQ